MELKATHMDKGAGVFQAFVRPQSLRNTWLKKQSSRVKNALVRPGWWPAEMLRSGPTLPWGTWYRGSVPAVSVGSHLAQLSSSTPGVSLHALYHLPALPWGPRDPQVSAAPGCAIQCPSVYESDFPIYFCLVFFLQTMSSVSTSILKYLISSFEVFLAFKHIPQAGHHITEPTVLSKTVTLGREIQDRWSIYQRLDLTTQYKVGSCIGFSPITRTLGENRWNLRKISSLVNSVASVIIFWSCDCTEMTSDVIVRRNNVKVRPTIVYSVNSTTLATSGSQWLS